MLLQSFLSTDGKYPDLPKNTDFSRIYSNTIDTILPDGSAYLQIVVPESLVMLPAYLEYVVGTLQAMQTTTEFRILFPSLETAERFLDLASNMPEFKVEHGKTQYFIVTPADQVRLASELNAIAKPYQIQIAVNSPELTDLMVNSFAWNFATKSLNAVKDEHIARVVEEAMHNIYTQTYMITEVGSGTLLASFTLLPLRDEVQLHSVAGRPPNVLAQADHKLGIIMSKVVGIMFAKFPGIPLTFNASGAAPIYESLGINHSSRYGVVLKRK